MVPLSSCTLIHRVELEILRAAWFSAALSMHANCMPKVAHSLSQLDHTGFEAVVANSLVGSGVGVPVLLVGDG